MNQKNSLKLDICFKDLKNPIELFKIWMNDAVKSELNDPNVLALATSGKNGSPSVRMVLLKDFSESGFVFYTSAFGESIKLRLVTATCRYEFFIKQAAFSAIFLALWSRLKNFTKPCPGKTR